MPQPLFVFIQFEFPWALGPADGRYLVRREADREPERVVVLGALEAARQPLVGPTTLGLLPGRLSKRSQVVPAGPQPAPVATTRVTVIDPVSLSAESQARAWLAELDRDREVRAAVAILNRVVHSHRVAAADPYVHEVSPAQALVIRAGWGEGEQVADGRWLRARALPPGAGARTATGSRRRGPGRDRSAALRPQERLAALLGARDATLLCEEIALRARQDLDHGRVAHAALELEHAYALAVRELDDKSRQDLAIRVAELEQLHAGVKEQAQAAMGTNADSSAEGIAAQPNEEVLAHALERLQAALRARTAAGFAS
jgi:hypothetical protein